MPDALTARLAELRALADAATTGPWRTYATDRQDDGIEVTERVYVMGGTRHSVAYVGRADVDDLHDPIAADARLIAASRTALPALLDAVEAVLALHEPTSETYRGSRLVVGPRGGTHREHYEYRVCMGEVAPDEYATDYPCPTVQAITRALEGL